MTTNRVAIVSFCLLSLTSCAEEPSIPKDFKGEYLIVSSEKLLRLGFADGNISVSSPSQYGLPDSVTDVSWDNGKRKLFVHVNDLTQSNWVVPLQAPESIYTFDLNRPSVPPEFIVEGYRPRICPDGSLLCYSKMNGPVVIFDTRERNERALIHDALSQMRFYAWVSNFELLYTREDEALCRFDVRTGVTSVTGTSGLVPGATSPDLTQVLCWSLHDPAVFLYDVNRSVSSKLLPRSGMRPGGTFVWARDGSSFLFQSQRIWDSDERSDVCFYSIKDKSSHLVMRNVYFNGGVCLN